MTGAPIPGTDNTAQDLHLPLGKGIDPSAKLLIAAMLAAGQNNCTCNTCQLMRKLGGSLSNVMMKEEAASEV